MFGLILSGTNRKYFPHDPSAGSGGLPTVRLRVPKDQKITVHIGAARVQAVQHYELRCNGWCHISVNTHAFLETH